MKTGILITTFLRDTLLKQCLENIAKYWQEDYYIIIIDQGHKENHSFTYPYGLQGEYIQTKFDIGALRARNIAIKRFHELKIPFILMSADSIMFNKKYDFSLIKEFLNKEDNRFLCGFNIAHRLPWECDMEKKECFYLDLPQRDIIKFKNIEFQPVDLCRNFFLAKTELLFHSLYDEDRKLADHETSFWRWKEKGYKCYYVKDIEAEYVLDRPIEYNKMRNRFSIMKKLMMKKYNLSGWVSYSKKLTEFWKEWKRNEK